MSKLKEKNDHCTRNAIFLCKVHKVKSDYSTTLYAGHGSMFSSSKGHDSLLITSYALFCSSSIWVLLMFPTKVCTI